MYEGSKAMIRTPHGAATSQWGCTKCPFLLLLTPDSIVNHLEQGPLRTIDIYADDIALVADNQKELEKVQLWQRALATTAYG
ncbi:unnamed protein product [Heligmosomoides polygyrus]|uniref:Reverse transcriptase domain-containing protein n=1 Tax=Heligmosomoides polygyrus TaxID=6339 RepID=A0A183FSB7_HELPZ|nr:unnamed protein product [Heligmosomoides polygyrus]